MVYYCGSTLIHSKKGVRFLAWSFSNEKAVYIQIAERIRNSILSGEYPPDGQIPSVRQLALISAVNPNTVQHAFTELEGEGLIVSKGTQGRFVTDDLSVIDSFKKKAARELVKQFLEDAKRMSLSKEDIITMIGDEDV